MQVNKCFFVFGKHVSGCIFEMITHLCVCDPQAHDIENLKRFLSSKKPHVVAVAGENR